MDKVTRPQLHFVLVHGACHGAWCWYKLTSLLEASGHRVTAVDLAASGVNMKKIDEVTSLSDYTSPLLEIMESVPEEEKVVLVGHSLGGLSLALAADRFPEKVSVAVFVTALMPDTLNNPLYVFEYCSGKAPPEAWMDTKFEFDNPNVPPKSMLFGPKVLASKLYQLSPPEDIALAKVLMRPAPFLEEPSEKANSFSNEGYGSVPRAFVVCNEDATVTVELQRWMIENAGVKEVKEIDGADHMPMFSKPQELCDCLLEIASNHL